MTYSAAILPLSLLVSYQRCSRTYEVATFAAIALPPKPVWAVRGAFHVLGTHRLTLVTHDL